MRRYPTPRLISLLSIAWAALVIGQDVATEPAPPAPESPSESSMIEAAIESYVAAFNAKDIQKLVSHWAEGGVYVSRSSGEQIAGRTALENEFTTILSAEDAPTLAVQTESIEFISPSVALERGSALISRQGESEETTYQVVYVKRSGQWLIDRVSEEVVPVRPSNYERLSGLEFLIGQWIDVGDGFTIEIDCEWTKNQSFISRKFEVNSDDGDETSGLQIIGWDAKQEQIRSWLFDSNGGFLKGEWTHHDDVWVVQSVATLPDGAAGSFTSVFRPVDEDSYGWKKMNRVLDGKLLPSLDEVIIRRR
jgi:uncharacterized protein (TIGR02246 family)